MEPLEYKYSWTMMANYLKNNLNVVKQSLNNCNFLSFVTSKEYNSDKGVFEPFTGYYAIMKNDMGGVDKVTLKLDKHYSDLKPQDFRELATYLGTKQYESGSAGTV